MKERVRVAVAQYAIVADLATNIHNAVEAATRAAGDGVELLVLPELADVGYPGGISAADMAEYYSRTATLVNPLVEALAEISRERSMYICVGHAERDPRVSGVLRNSATLLRPDGAPEVFRKVHLPRIEKLYFMPGSSLEPVDTPLGRLGILVCADNSFPEAARLLTLRGAELLIVLYMSPVHRNGRLYEAVCTTRAYENQIFVVAASCAGEYGEGRFAGNSTIVGPDGFVLSSLGGDPGMAVGDLLRDDLLAQRQFQTRFADRRPELYGDLARGTD